VHARLAAIFTERIVQKAVYSHWILQASPKKRYYMKNIARLLSSWFLHAATKGLGESWADTDQALFGIDLAVRRRLRIGSL
jgi:hypothetical protein